jgi:hypothetical protein
MERLAQFCFDAQKRPVAREVTALADIIRARHAGVVAVLAYGSCLRGTAFTDSLIDYYVLTEDLRGVSSNRLSRWACRLVPPNVYYAEAQIDGQRLRAKYAVLPLLLFARWMKRDTLNPYFWARFAQPSALIWACDEAAREQIARATAEALETFWTNAQGLDAHGASIWAAGFRSTYASELRSESVSRAEDIVAANLGYYHAAETFLGHVAPHRADARLQRMTGKLWSLVRLMKASFTFQGGADYLAWKIERHSGEKITLKPWQRRHPIIAGALMLPALRRKGAIR